MCQLAIFNSWKNKFIGMHEQSWDWLFQSAGKRLMARGCTFSLQKPGTKFYFWINFELFFSGNKLQYVAVPVDKAVKVVIIKSYFIINDKKSLYCILPLASETYPIIGYSVAIL